MEQEQEKEEQNKETTQPQQPFVNKDEVSEIEFIQQEIQMIAKKIEREKNNMMLLEERHSKQKKEYDKLEGRPANLTKEEKAQKLQEKKKQMKNRKISDQLQSKKVRKDFADEENLKVQKQTAKIEVNLDVITKEIDKYALENESLTKEIDDLRKEKTQISNQLDSYQEKNKKLQEELNDTIEKNNAKKKTIKHQELKDKKEESLLLQQDFERERDNLEGKYHEIIETTIKREREHKKEVFKKRLMLGMIADNVKKNKEQNAKIEEQMNQMTKEEMCDREPILDILLEKWKFFIKFKKSFLNKYIQNAKMVREAFDKITLFLGVDSFDELPAIYVKNDEQMESIENYSASLTEDITKLEEQKRIIQLQIDTMKSGKDQLEKEDLNFVETKQKSIENLKQTNQNLMEEIKNKRKFLSCLQPRTFSFLEKMQNSYLKDYVCDNVTLSDDTKINETNVIEFLSSVQNYISLINDFDKSTQNLSTTIDEDNYNTEIAKIKSEFNKKYDFLSPNIVGEEFFKKIKVGIKSGDYEGSIKNISKLLSSQVSGEPIKGEPDLLKRRKEKPANY